MIERIDCAVIGAGVVGLAVARALAQSGREVIVLESESAIGTGTSSAFACAAATCCIGSAP
jgi:L-2-hydroxyglutarate oxidase LhgO